ncbi:interferon alpha/beta receptor 2 isoform X2 [Phyllostomus hastatus]|uniref:interferon alpha/beta receptor 2 isoform X2 n=1 Tax=Phyllostomus hastatus TaxID=9423 RepID=UPI001E67FE4D|nr:interferon alpha/beta receptor 2 isoform X2 [Phyllostomus hastatus]
MTRMLWGHDACAGRPLALCLLGSICLMSGAPQPLPELSDGPCDINMVLRNFRPVISWKLRSVSIAPTHYTLWYANMSDRKDMEVVEHCANITSLSCDVTDLWADVSEMYELQLVGSRGNATAVQCFRNIFPELDMRLEPPEFEVAGFTDHIRVTLLLPETLPKGPQDQELWSHFPLIIEEQLEGIAKKHKLKINEDTKGNFTYILDKLIPNTTYCVSVYFNPRNVENVIRSPQKCTHLPPARQSVSPESAIIGAFMSVAFVVAVAVSALMTLRRVGYICLRSVPPKVLNSAVDVFCTGCLFLPDDPVGRKPGVRSPCRERRPSVVTPAVGTRQGTHRRRAPRCLSLPPRSLPPGGCPRAWRLLPRVHPSLSAKPASLPSLLCGPPGRRVSARGPSRAPHVSERPPTARPLMCHSPVPPLSVYRKLAQLFLQKFLCFCVGTDSPHLIPHQLRP